MAQAFKPVVLLAFARLDRRVMLGAWLAFVALLGAAIYFHNAWLWSAVFAVLAVGGWFALRCVAELVMVIIEVLLPQ